MIGVSSLKLTYSLKIDPYKRRFLLGFPSIFWGENVSFRERTSLPTPGKINMEPENTPLEEESHLPNHHFQVRFVNLRGCIAWCFSVTGKKCPTTRGVDKIEKVKRPPAVRLWGETSTWKTLEARGGLMPVIPLPMTDPWDWYILTYMKTIRYQPNVGKSTIHGSYMGY